MSHGGLEIEHLVDVVPIDQGRPGDLYAATDLKLDRRVAVRLLPTASATERSDFLDRARSIGRLSAHPGIVTVYDTGIAGDGRPYLVMELIDGPNLGARLDEAGPLPWPDACDLALQLSAGLTPIHQGGQRYHDLRPEYVLLAGTQAKLSDVGLIGPGRPGGPATEPAAMVHQPRETIRGVADERSDLYSLTSVLYQAIDGSAPYGRPNDSIDALRARILAQQAPPLDPELVPPALAVFVAAGLSPDPVDRPQSATEFTRELELIRQGRTTGSTPSLLHATSGTVPVIATAPPATAGAVDTVEPTRVAAAAPVGAGLAGPSVAVGDHAGVDPAGPWPPPGPDHPRTGPITVAATTFGELAPPIDGPTPSALAPAGPDLGGPGLDLGPIDPDPWGGPTTDQTMVAQAPPLIPFDEPGQAGPPDGRRPRSPLLIGALAMVAVGLLGLAGVLALSLGGDESTDGSAAPLLPDPNAPTEAVDGAEVDPGTPTSLTPLAMIEESTTTTIDDSMVTSTDTTIQRVTVPNVVNLDVEGAGQLLGAAGFEILVVGRVSPGSAPGTVIQQTPAAGTTIDLPATVTLFIPRSAVLPFMIGRPAETVCLQLTALGLDCQQTLRFDDRVPAGAVIATDPAEGAAFAEGQTIRLTVSRGPLVEVAIPQVAGQSENEARATLGEAGFVAVTTRSEASDAVPAGQAIGTEPATGTRLGIDQPVVIVLSSGPAPRVAVPELIGLDRAAAEAALAAAQLTGTFVNRSLPPGDPGIGVVLAVDPPVGTVAQAGATVTVTMGQVDPASTTTTTAPTSTTEMMSTTTTTSSDG